MEMHYIFYLTLIACVLFLALTHLIGVDHHGGDAGHGHGGADGGHDGLMTNLFTLRNALLFGTGFGACGAIAHGLGQTDLASSFWGLGAGVILGLVGAWFYGTLRRQQSNSLTDLTALVNHEARVIIAIPLEGRGEITTLNLHGVRETFPAQSTSGPVAENTMVRITAMIGGTASIEPIV